MRFAWDVPELRERMLDALQKRYAALTRVSPLPMMHDYAVRRPSRADLGIAIDLASWAANEVCGGPDA